MLNKNALIASDWVLIPARADHLSTLGIEYLVGHFEHLIADYRRFRGGAKSPYQPIAPKIVGVVFGMVNMIKGVPVKALQTFIDEVKNLPGLEVFETIVRHNAGLFASAPRDGIPVAVKSSVLPEIAQELDDLADEFIKRTDLRGKDL